MASSTGLVGGRNSNRPTRNSAAVQGSVTRHALAALKVWWSTLKKDPPCTGRCLQRGLAGVLGLMPSRQGATSNLASRQVPPKIVAEMKQQGGLFVFFLGCRGGGMRQTIPIINSPCGGCCVLCSSRISGKLGCTLARTRKLN